MKRYREYWSRERYLTGYERWVDDRGHYRISPIYDHIKEVWSLVRVFDKKIHGEFRQGRSYRRNPDHQKKVRDVNRELWRESRKDWRHLQGYRCGCRGCSRCMPREVYYRVEDRARWRNILAAVRRDPRGDWDDLSPKC